MASLANSKIRANSPNLVAALDSHDMGGAAGLPSLFHEVAPPWYSAGRHYGEREKMVKTITKYLECQPPSKPGPPEKWQAMLPPLVKMMEVALFRNSKSLDSYTNRSTLKQRLRDIVTEMGLGAADLRAKQAKAREAAARGAADGEGSESGSGGAARKSGATASSQGALAGTVGSLGSIGLAGGPPAISQAALASLDGLGSSTLSLQDVNMGSIGDIGSVGNMGNLGNIAGVSGVPGLEGVSGHGGGRTGSKSNKSKGSKGSKKGSKGSAAAGTGSAKGTSEGSSGRTSNEAEDVEGIAESKSPEASEGTHLLLEDEASLRSVLNLFKTDSNSPPLTGLHEGDSAGPMDLSLSTSTNSESMDLVVPEDIICRSVELKRKEQGVRRKQQLRLLWLRHAAQCPHEPGHCPETAHCAVLKKLWRHVNVCKDQNCTVAHCVSSRYILYHYYFCQKRHCPVCGPVVKTILREKEQKDADQASDSASLALASSDQSDSELADLADMEFVAATGEPVIETANVSMIRYLTLDEIQQHVASVAVAFTDGVEGSQGASSSADRLVLTSGDGATAMDLIPQSQGRQRKGRSPKACASATGCLLCGQETVQFEPPGLYCCGDICNGMVIPRNAHFYTLEGQSKAHWCQACHADLKDNRQISIPGYRFWKREMIRLKNDEMQEEGWVECDACHGWVHQICGLFNPRQDDVQSTPYHCPSCVANERIRNRQSAPTTQAKSAADLPHTSCSRHIEDRVKAKLQQEYEKHAQERGVDVSQVPQAGPIFIRQVSNLQGKRHSVKARFLARTRRDDFPRHFPYTSKCVMLFEKIDGVDVLLFAMYLHEYGHKAPQPNHRRVYVSYIDSVHYFRPRQYRTLVYHEMLLAYLEYAKMRGFHTAHIWACPPKDGRDDYVFYGRPEEQKTPREERLRRWYGAMLEKSKAEGVVTNITTLFDEYFREDLIASGKSKATDVPYFEGDFWVTEAEAILENMEAERSRVRAERAKAAVANKLDNSSSGQKPSVARTASSDRSDRRSPRDRDSSVTSPRCVASSSSAAGAASATASSSSSSSSSSSRKKRMLRSDGDADECDGRDPLMVRMARTMEPSKDAFLVAYLQPRSFAEATWQRRLSEPDFNADAMLLDAPLTQTDVLDDDEIPGVSATSPRLGSAFGGARNPYQQSYTNKRRRFAQTPGAGGGGSLAPSGARQRAEDGSQRSARSMRGSSRGDSASSTASSASFSTVGDVIEDETVERDPEIEGDFMDTRQKFLGVCQGNNYRFDSLRRAKHTSLMVVYHAHHPQVPKFTIICSNCANVISKGIRFDCVQCPDFHLCGPCQSAGAASQHRHRLRKAKA